MIEPVTDPVAEPMDATLAGVAAVARHAGVELGDVAPPREHTVEASGLRLHVLDWGRADDPPVLLLHGGSLNAHSWDLVCAALSADHRCVAPDLRGHGDSGWVPDADYRIASAAGDMAAVWSALRHDARPPVVIGLSYGGVIAVHSIAHGLLDAERLVVVDITPDLNIERSEHIRAFAEPDELPSIDAFVARARAFNSRRPAELLRHSLGHNLRPGPGGGWTWKYDPARMATADFAAMAAEHGALWHVLDRITCPALILHGERSRIVTADEAERFAAALPDARVVHVQDAGHTVHSDNPAAFLNAVRVFLK